MSDPFVAEIRIFPFNFAPRGWAFCNGQLLPISQNTALFSLLGTTYGGNGQSNFALPNLEGSAPMNPDQGPGLSLHFLGETGGSDNVTLIQSELPSHQHSFTADPTAKTEKNTVANNTPAGAGQGNTLYSSTAGVNMNPGTLALTGGGLPHNNMQPYLCLNFCIAMQGVFPPRS
ncbi:MAG: tail fiber protein [Bryobacteraceae bacterium]|jgi:microcystin-dependent protein